MLGSIHKFVLSATNYGGFGAVNGLWSATDNPGGSEFLINELGSYCISGSVQEQVGVVVGRLPGVYGNSYVLAAEYFGGSQPGGWVGVNYTPGYTQFSGQITPGTVLTGTSTQGGTQYEAPLHIVFRDDTNPKRWELGYNGIGFGYVEVTTAGFSLINASACIISHYSEAYDPNHTNQPWMDSDMGSSLFPTSTLIANNWGSRAWFRAARYYTAPQGGGLTNTSAAAGATDRFCYDARRVTDGSPSSTWNPTLFFGGPGGDGTLCTQDPSCQTGLANGTACCAESCGACGGSGCGSRPGGAANCCTSNINSSSKFCSSNRPPCRL
jgi:hypothetical protein